MTPTRKDLEVSILNRTLGRRNYKLSEPCGPNAELTAAVMTDPGNTYGLIIKLEGFPEVCPSIYVKGELKNWKGRPMSSTDASMHCYGYENGNTKLCYGWTSSWNPQVSLLYLYMRGKIWLECYEMHLVTGNPIDYYLPHA
jgi:hypothetical protein